MKSVDLRKKIQALLGTKQDGSINISPAGETMRAFCRLAAMPPEADWVNGDAVPSHGALVSGDPAWLTIARLELGTTEIPGERDNPRIVEYHQACSLRASDDETPWCSAFVNWCLQRAGYAGTKNAMARSFLDFGQVLSLPKPGAIVVFRRGAPPQGHVAFFLEASGSLITVLGGNQGNRVSVASYPASDLLGYRWPV